MVTDQELKYVEDLEKRAASGQDYDLKVEAQQ